jgi:tRNA-dihydrouridine synthase A
MSAWDQRFFDSPAPVASREALEQRWLAYLERHVVASVSSAQANSWPQAMRHALGLWNGTPGARRWRQVWSDHKLKLAPPQQVAALATEARLGTLRHQQALAKV